MYFLSSNAKKCIIPLEIETGDARRPLKPDPQIRTHRQEGMYEKKKYCFMDSRSCDLRSDERLRRLFLKFHDGCGGRNDRGHNHSGGDDSGRDNSGIECGGKQRFLFRRCDV